MAKQIKTFNNEFPIAYMGNKRKEFHDIYDNINFNDIDTIIEPYAGTAAVSYYISKLHPKKYKYILNDNSKFLIEFYNILKNDDERTIFEKKINDICIDIDKKKYKALDRTLLTTWYIHNKLYKIHPHLFPLDYKYKYISLKGGYVDFLQNEDITIIYGSGMDIYIKYCDSSNCFIFIDPPYLFCNNADYETPEFNIYQHIAYNNIMLNKAKIMFCLEYSWIIKLLFQHIKNILVYDKRYDRSKRKTQHAIMFNYLK